MDPLDPENPGPPHGPAERVYTDDPAAEPRLVGPAGRIQPLDCRCWCDDCVCGEHDLCLDGCDDDCDDYGYGLDDQDDDPDYDPWDDPKLPPARLLGPHRGVCRCYGDPWEHAAIVARERGTARDRRRARLRRIQQRRRDDREFAHVFADPF